MFGGPGKNSIHAGFGFFHTALEGLSAGIMSACAPYGYDYDSTGGHPLFDEPFMSAITGLTNGQPFPSPTPKFGASDRASVRVEAKPSATLARMNATTRRMFLGQCAVAAAGASFLPKLAHAAGSGPAVKFPSAPRDRVAVAAYPFREFIVGWKGWDGKTPSTVPVSQQMQLKDFAAHVAEKFNVHKIEPWSPIFPSTAPKYLEEFRAAVERAGSAVVDIAVDGGHSQYSTDAAEREKAVKASNDWIDVGAALGSPSIRTHIDGAKDSKPDVGRATDTLARVAEYGAKKNIVVHLENDNPVSEDPFFIVQVIERVNSPWLRALPDFGNSLVAHGEEFSDRAMEAMFAHAYGICHVKNGEVDDNGKMVNVDLARTFGILKRHGYKGYCSIEYDAPGDPYKPTADLVEQTIKYLS
jgi:sugar phosphate isomerase/epimerase